MAGGKTVKACITANFCCNASGTNKLPIWFIETAAKPRCFTQAHVNICNLAMIWQHNQKGKINFVISQEYFYWFNNRMTEQKMVLLINGFCAHSTGLDLIKAEERLDYVKVMFLPPNITSMSQPLDQSIIQTWKAYYQRQWLQYVIQE